jgi:hypothetical protein
MRNSAKVDRNKVTLEVDFAYLIDADAYSRRLDPWMCKLSRLLAYQAGIAADVDAWKIRQRAFIYNCETERLGFAEMWMEGLRLIHLIPVFLLRMWAIDWVYKRHIARFPNL